MSEQAAYANLFQSEFQFVLPDGADTEPLVFPDGRSIPLLICRSNRARRYRIHVSAAGEVRIVVPRRGSRLRALGFAREQSAWIERQVTRMARQGLVRQRPIRPGDRVLFRGEMIPVVLRVENGIPTIRVGNASCTVGEIASDLTSAVRDLMWEIAKKEMPGRARQLANVHGCRVGTVVVRDLKASWGRCQHAGRSADGAHVSLNWRLIQAPPAVCDYVILHELMHIREMNHSHRFWAEVSSVCPDHEAAERWLKEFRYKVLP